MVMYVISFCLFLFALTTAPLAQQVKIEAIGDVCLSKEACSQHDAIVFIHGIYGNDSTFKNGDFNWPVSLKKDFSDQNLDVYLIKYNQALIEWLKKDVATLDEIVEALFGQLHGDREVYSHGLLFNRPYRSVGIIGHSLGGNVATAYLHYVKSELGHTARAKHPFILTLGTPLNGSQIANVALIAKQIILGWEDPLLRSLQHDNTFLRMMTGYRRAERNKASRFECRPVHLYAGVEGARVLGLRIVPLESAVKPLQEIGAKEIKYFESYDHSEISKPSDRSDPLYVWVKGIIDAELKRVRRHSGCVCKKVGVGWGGAVPIGCNP